MSATETGAFAGKVAFITGASSGIGRATALAFAAGGANVVVSATSEEGIAETARLIEERGARTYTYIETPPSGSTLYLDQLRPVARTIHTQ